VTMPAELAPPPGRTMITDRAAWALRPGSVSGRHVAAPSAIQRIHSCWLRSRKYRGCRHVATPRPSRLRPPQAGTVPGHPVPRNSRSSNSSRQSDGRATLSATAPPLYGHQHPAQGGEPHSPPGRTACGAPRAGGRRSIRKPVVRTCFIRPCRDRPPALPSSRTPCRQGRHHRALTGTCHV
jgi:hypothetical protein